MDGDCSWDRDCSWDGMGLVYFYFFYSEKSGSRDETTGAEWTGLDWTGLFLDCCSGLPAGLRACGLTAQREE